MLSLLVQESVNTKQLVRACKRTGVTLTQVPGRTVQSKLQWRLVRDEETGLVENMSFTVSTEFDRYTLDGFPEVSGYAFMCRIEHTPAGNMGAGPELPAGWRDAKPTCDHCQTKRARKDTFYLRHSESGEVVRVGRNCLADFLRADPTQLVALAKLHASLDEMQEEDFGGGCSWGPSVDTYLGFAVASIEANGFRKSREEGPTVNHVSFLMGPKPTMGCTRDWEAGQPTKRHFKRALEIQNWLLVESKDASDYMHNLRVAAAQPGVTHRTAGLLASAPQAYDRAAPKPVAALPPSEHIGTVGERITREATLVRRFVTESDFGSKTLLSFRTLDGHDLTWWCSGREPLNAEGDYLEPGDRVTVVGTVKRHGEFKGRKQTTLSRCKVSPSAAV